MKIKNINPWQAASTALLGGLISINSSAQNIEPHPVEVLQQQQASKNIHVNTLRTHSAMSSMSASANDTTPLGTAYNSDEGYYLGLQSVAGQMNETLGNTVMDFRVGVDLSYSHALELIDGTVDAGFNFPAIRVDAGANYAKEISADQYTGTYSVYAALKAKSQVLLPQSNTGYQPTSAAQELAIQYPGDRQRHLGDEFLHGLALGSHVVINMKIEYRDEADKRAIGGYLNVDWVGKIKVSGELQKLDDEKKKSVKITISGYQAGGDHNELLKIIPNGIMLCTLENPTPCFDLFAEAVHYLKTNYINQLDTLEEYNVTKPYMVSYQHAGPALQSLVPDDGYRETSFLTKLIVKDLTNRWVEEKLTYRRAKNIQRYYASSFTSEQLTQLAAIEDMSRDNANLYADIVDYCELNPQGVYCSNFEQQAVASRFQDYSDISSVLN